MNSYFRSTFAIALCAMLGTWAMAAANVKIPAGTSVQVRITEKLSSETANVGDIFHGSLAAPVVANGRTLFPKGAIVTGEVVNVERSGRLSKPGELHLNLRAIRTGGRSYPVSVQTVVISDCLVNDRAGLPPGLAKKDRSQRSNCARSRSVVISSQLSS